MLFVLSFYRIKRRLTDKRRRKNLNRKLMFLRLVITISHWWDIDSHHKAWSTENSASLGSIDQLSFQVLARWDSCGNGCEDCGQSPNSRFWSRAVENLENLSWIFRKICREFRNLLLRMISTIFTIRSCCLQAAFKPAITSVLYSTNKSESAPPMTSTNSGVNLNGDCSKPE